MGIIVISIYRGFIKKWKFGIWMWYDNVGHICKYVFLCPISEVCIIWKCQPAFEGELYQPLSSHTLSTGAAKVTFRESRTFLHCPFSNLSSLFQRRQQKSHFERGIKISPLKFSSIRELSVVVQTELVWRICCYIWRAIYFTNPCAVALSSHVYPFKRGALKYLLFWIAPSLYI